MVDNDESIRQSVEGAVEHRLIRPMEDFRDPKQEWRRLVSELLGTFFLVLVAAGGGMMTQAFPDTILREAAVTAPGLMVLGIILFMGKISGAHLNPAVSLAFAARGDFQWRRVPGYIVVQLLGATLACLFLQAVVDGSATFGSGVVMHDIDKDEAVSVEAVQIAGSKVLYRRGNTWYSMDVAMQDAEKLASKAIVVERYSAEYFKLVEKASGDDRKALAAQPAAASMMLEVEGDVYEVK